MKARRDRVRYSLVIDTDLIDRLQEVSAQTDLSVSHLIREFIRKGLDNHHTTKEVKDA